MSRRKFIALTTEQDIETACQNLDRRCLVVHTAAVV